MTAGRPSKYTDDILEQAYKLALLGATDKQLADFFHISTVTLDNWKTSKPEFLCALKEGKDKADAEVADSLYNRAIGYQYIEQEPIKLRKGKDEHGGIIEEVQIVEVTKVMPPDTTACIFWLKNRQKEQWRDKQDVEHSGNVDLEFTIAPNANSTIHIPSPEALSEAGSGDVQPEAVQSDRGDD